MCEVICGRVCFRLCSQLGLQLRILLGLEPQISLKHQLYFCTLPDVWIFPWLRNSWTFKNPKRTICLSICFMGCEVLKFTQKYSLSMGVVKHYVGLLSLKNHHLFMTITGCMEHTLLVLNSKEYCPIESWERCCKIYWDGNFIVFTFLYSKPKSSNLITDLEWSKSPFALQMYKIVY